MLFHNTELPSIPRAEYADRRDEARRRAAAAGLDGLLVWSMGGSTLDRYANVFYLTNHYDPGNVYPDVEPYFRGFGQAAVVLPVDGPAILVVNQPDWRDDFVDCDEVRVARDLYAGVAGALADAGLAAGRVGLTDEERMGVSAFRAIGRAQPGLRLERADELLNRMRMVKSPAEVAMLRHASAVSCEIMAAMLEMVAEGRTDGDVAGAGAAVACRLGAQPYDFALASGPEDGHLWWSRLPSWNWQRPYERGDIVHPDIYGAVGGYFYDFVRSAVAGGDPTAAQREILEAAIGCIHAACGEARPGRTGSDVYRACRSYLRDAGVDHEPTPDAASALSEDVLESCGHGIGVGWDLPTLTPAEQIDLVPGMVLAIEQHVSRPDAGTCRYEEVVLVTDGDPEILTASCPARWW